MQNVSLSEYGGSGINAQHFQEKQQRRNHLLTQRNESYSNRSQNAFSQTLIVDETKQYMDSMVADEETDDEILKEDKSVDLKKPGKKTRGRVKIKMEFIQNKLRRYTTFSKRKTGIMKKAYELSTLTGTQVMLLVASETGHVYTFATRKLQPMITSESGKALIQTCLNSPDPTPAAVLPQGTVPQPHITAISAPVVQQQQSPSQVNLPVAASEQRMSQTGYEEPDLQYSNSEDEIKAVQTTTGSIHYVSPSTSTFPMTTYITAATTQHQASSKTLPVTYAVQPVGGIATIFSPANSSGLQIHSQNNNSQQTPQILSGQLQLHRIHPQNIILTGNSSSLQSNHIILNPSTGGTSSLVMATDDTQSTNRQNQQSQSTQQDVITLVNSELSQTTPVQMVYNPSSGVIYAPHNSSFKRSESGNDVLSLQHTPVIQTALQQDTRHMEEPSIIVRHSQSDIVK